MWDIAMPPETQNTQTVMVGQISKAQQVMDEIEAARLDYLKNNIRGAISERTKILHYAFVSGMSDAEFRVLWGYLMAGNRDGESISIGQKRIGWLTGKKERTVRSLTNDLEAARWLSNPTKRQRQAAIRSAGIPPEAMRSIIHEIVDRQKSAGQAVEIPVELLPRNLDRQKSAINEPLTGNIASFRPAETRHRTIEDKPYPHTRARARRVDPASWQMAALNASERSAQKRIWFVEGGAIDISDELRAELAGTFPLVPIEPTLVVLRTEAKPSETAFRLLEALMRKMAYAQRDEMGRERRYAERAAQKPPEKYPRKTDDDDKKRRELRALGVKI